LGWRGAHGPGLDTPQDLKEDRGVRFELVGAIEQIETIAAGPGVTVRSLWSWPVAKTQGSRHRPTTEWQASSGRAALVRGARHRQTGYQDQELLGHAMKPPIKPFALCLENTENEASLIVGKVYRIVPDVRAAKDDLVRIIDESGEDYLFDKTQFAFVDFPQAVRKKLLALQRAS
jgi:hypothetical protein